MAPQSARTWGYLQEGRCSSPFRLGIPDPKSPQESILEANKNRRDFYRFPQPKGQETEAWDKANKYLRNTPSEDKQKNIIGSEIRSNTTLGRELSKLDINVQKGVNMNTMIDGMDKSGGWANNTPSQLSPLHLLHCAA